MLQAELPSPRSLLASCGAGARGRRPGRPGARGGLGVGGARRAWVRARAVARAPTSASGFARRSPREAATLRAALAAPGAHAARARLGGVAARRTPTASRCRSRSRRTGRSARTSRRSRRSSRCVLPPLRWPRPARGRASSWSRSWATPRWRPIWAWRWEGHPGNEPKYLRQAVALAPSARFDAEGVSARDGGAPSRSPARPRRAAPRATARARVAARMIAAVARGEAGRDAIRATPRHAADDARQGRRHLLRARPRAVAAARADAAPRPRGQPRSRRQSGRVAFSVLLWCALGGAARGCAASACWPRRDRAARGSRRRWRSASRSCRRSSSTSTSSTRRWWARSFSPWPSACSRCGPTTCARRPWLVRRGCSPRCRGCTRSSCRCGWSLTLTAVVVAWSLRARAPAEPPSRSRAGSWRAALLVPQAVSLYLFALYNFAITGSVRPDALFLAWGPARRDERARRPGRPRPAARRALRHRAVRAGAAAGRGRPRGAAARGASRSCCPRPPSTT